jgi:UDP-glucuronate 4-epimerase
LPMQPGDVPATHASIAKLKAWVDFAPTTPLATGLANFWTWYRDWAPTRA